MPGQFVALSIVVLAAGVFHQGGDPAKQPKKSLAAWAGLFPNITGYQLVFHDAEVKGDKKSPIYSQRATYVWAGGADRGISVTIARNAEFKTLYSEDAIKKLSPMVKKIDIGKHAAWLVEFEKKADKKAGPAIINRLIVPLGDDRVVVIDQSGLGPFVDTAKTVAEKLDFDKINKALDNPPDTGSHRTVEAFRQLKKGMSYSDVSTWVGYADKDIGSGIHIMTYALDDGTRVLLGFPDFNKLIYVKHEGKDGKVVDLVD